MVTSFTRVLLGTGHLGHAELLVSEPRVPRGKPGQWPGFAVRRCAVLAATCDARGRRCSRCSSPWTGPSSTPGTSSSSTCARRCGTSSTPLSTRGRTLPSARTCACCGGASRLRCTWRRGGGGWRSPSRSAAPAASAGSPAAGSGSDEQPLAARSGSGGNAQADALRVAATTIKPTADSPVTSFLFCFLKPDPFSTLLWK